MDITKIEDHNLNVLVLGLTKCLGKLVMQFLPQLVHLYSMNHISQAGMLLSWQKMIIPRDMETFHDIFR